MFSIFIAESKNEYKKDFSFKSEAWFWLWISIIWEPISFIKCNLTGVSLIKALDFPFTEISLLNITSSPQSISLTLSNSFIK